MYMDSNLKAEVISSLFGQNVTPFDRKRCQTTANILSVDDFHLHNLIGKQQACAEDFFINAEKFFDSAYDCDFTDLSDSAECTRGDELYERPKGWYRMALKVKGRYPDGDAWLGTKAWRSHSVPGEWPVSYHGTSLDGVKGIIRSNYTAGGRALYGRGIYSTPDIHVAEREDYAKTFTSETTGKSYKVILQNRINPEKREICRRSDYWLIPVPKGASAAVEKQIVESSIRPYGILIKELNDPCGSSPTSRSKPTAALTEAPPPIQHRLPLHLGPQLPSICPLFPPATLIAGDSVVRGIRFFNADTCCFPGSTVPDILANLQSLLPTLPSSVNRLIVHVGTNDTARQHSELTKKDFNDLLEFLKKSGKEVFLSGPIPTLSRGSVRFSRIRSLNIWLQSACRAHNIGFIDSFNLFWNRPSLYARDGLHPNKAGAKVLKANIQYTVHSYPHD
ncbi:uncharacterized protein [Cebidichthys violaceus]|uniref:uncharacterized protein n=1 Tax=Cebidichthys violaceus TaxID=271503 RepID=UPI0035CB9503